MNWLKRPKVLFGLVVNGAYLLYCLLPHVPFLTAATLPTTVYEKSAPSEDKKPLPFVSLPPSSGPLKASYYKQQEQMNVYLKDDLTLVRTPGHQLSLSPSFSSKGNGTEEPSTVLLSFFSVSSKQAYPERCAFKIEADGVEMWPIRSSTEIQHYLSVGDDGAVHETMGREITFEDFLRVITAKRVVVTLGNESEELSPEQVEPLRDMYRLLQRFNPPQVSPPPPSATPASEGARSTITMSR